MRKALLLALLLFDGRLLCANDIPAAQASSHAGETATVCCDVTGIHTAARTKGKPTFINLDKRYPTQDFTVMIWDDDRAGLGDLEKYAGYQVVSQGVITMYRGKPEMVLRSSELVAGAPQRFLRLGHDPHEVSFMEGRAVMTCREVI